MLEGVLFIRFGSRHQSIPVKQETKEREKEAKNVYGGSRYRAENMYRETCEGMLLNMPVTVIKY